MPSTEREPDTETPLADPPQAASPRADVDKPSRWVAVSVGLAAVLCLVFLVGTVAAGSVLPVTAGNRESTQERARAIATAEQFTLRMDNVDGSKFDAYVAGISELLTTKAKAENEQSLVALKETYEAAEVKGTGEVLVSGVASLDDDSATVLVAHDADVSTAQGDIEHHYRWSVDLVKVDGGWLVDGFTPVT